MTTHKLYIGKNKELHVKEVETQPLKPGFVHIKPRAVAVNPTDYKHVKFQLTEGTGVGADFAGEVIEVGPNVTDLKVGDTVSGICNTTDHNNPDSGAYATLITAEANSVLKFPHKLVSDPENRIAPGPVKSFEQAAALGVSVETAAVAFYWYNKTELIKNSKSGYALVYGAASSLGFQVTKLAHFLGYKVIAVASKKHAEFLKEHGAEYVVDYHDEDWVDQVKKIGGEDIVYAYDTISHQATFDKVYEAVSSTKEVKVNGSLHLLKTPEKAKKNVQFDVPLLYFLYMPEKVFGNHTVPGDVKLMEERPVIIKRVNELIAEGLFTAPSIDVTAEGFDNIPALFDRFEKGASCEKIVIRLD